MARQKHDLGWQKRQKALPEMKAAVARRIARKARRLSSGLSPFMERWLRSGPGRGYNKYPSDT